MIKKFTSTFVLVDLCVLVVSFIFGDSLWVINTQMAFISSMLITIGSYVGYKNNINKRVQNVSPETLDDLPDAYDIVDDKFDLYSENEINEKELTSQEVQDIFQEEKSKLKNKNTFMNTIRTTTAATSIYRIFGYASLVLGFFYLRNNDLFLAIPYLIGFLIVPLGVLFNYKSIKT